jgi:lipopolysaccharide biosynthesis regulator YciM
LSVSEHYINVEILQTVVSIVVMVLVLLGFMVRLSRLVDSKFEEHSKSVLRVITEFKTNVGNALERAFNRQDRLERLNHRLASKFAALEAEHELLVSHGIHCENCSANARKITALRKRKPTVYNGPGEGGGEDGAGGD